jgi:transaldolase
MRLFLDTIEPAELAGLWACGAFHGVTTNPLILARGGATAEQAVERCQKLGVERLFLQAAWGEPPAIVADAERLAALFGGRLWIKIPALEHGFAAFAALRRAGIRTAATAILTLGQALLAAEAGADVLIPFVGRAAQAGGADGAARLLDDVRRVAADHRLRVLAASIKSEEHARLALRAECWAVTLPGDVARSFVTNPAAAAVLEQFRRAASAAGEE